MLRKMYRITFGIYSPPTADWAEYETNLLYFSRSGLCSFLPFGGVVSSRLRNQRPSNIRRWSRCRTISIAATIIRKLRKVAH